MLHLKHLSVPSLLFLLHVECHLVVPQKETTASIGGSPGGIDLLFSLLSMIDR